MIYKGFLFFIYYQLKINNKIKIMKNYRFKTEEEFLKEYGEDWKNLVKYGWDEGDEMDFLFGVDITEQQRARLIAGHLEIDGWMISEGMCTEESIIPDFKDGIRIIKNGLMAEYEEL